MILTILLGVLLGMVPTIFLDAVILLAGNKIFPQYIQVSTTQVVLESLIKLVIFQFIIIFIASLITKVARAILPGFLAKLVGVLGFVIAIVGTFYALQSIQGSGITLASTNVQWIMALILGLVGDASTLLKK